MTKVKLCGFRDRESILAAVAAGVDFIGFVFCEKSVRYISPQDSAEVSKIIPESIAKVAVLVDVDLEFLARVDHYLHPEYFQFHGSETPTFLREVRAQFPHVQIIKAFRIHHKEDVKQVEAFEDVVDLFLFDSKHQVADGAMGGTGKVFDWNVLSDLKTNKEWFLSGGLCKDNVMQAVDQTGAKMIDVSSGIEEVRGEKSVDLIESFMKEMRKA